MRENKPARMDRRRFLALGAAATMVVPLLAACGGGATAAVTGSSASAGGSTASAAASSAAATTSSAAAAVAAQTTTVESVPQIPASAKITIRLMKFAGVGWEQDDRAAENYMKAHPDVGVKVEPTIYDQMFNKCLTLGAAGTLGDLFAGHNKWMPYLDYKGICLDLDALVAQNKQQMNFDDFFPSVLADAKGIGADGKLYVLPTVVHPGGNAIVLINTDLLDKAGVKLPTDGATNDWTISDLENIARKAADPKNGIFGTQVTYSSTLYADQVTRTWGSGENDYSSWLLSQDGKKQQLDSPPVKASFEWYRKLIADGIVPTSADAPPNTPGADFFTAGKLVTQGAIVGQYIADTKTINGKFKFQALLWPKGEKGYRGSCLSYNTYAIYSHTKYPDQSFGLLDMLTSSDTGLWASSQGESEPYARKSVWASPDLWKANPITKAAGEWLSAGVQPFPQPYNLRFSQWLDAWTQNTANYLNGKENWDQMYAHTQKACQDILDQPRP